MSRLLFYCAITGFLRYGGSAKRYTDFRFRNTGCVQCETKPDQQGGMNAGSDDHEDCHLVKILYNDCEN